MRTSSLFAGLAQTPAEREKAFALRHEIFRSPSRVLARDEDVYDAACDHLLILDNETLVGTCRLLRQSVAQKAHGFYSATEFDVAPLLARQSELEFLEIGRTCIRESHRSGGAATLLWQAIWNYVRLHKLGAMMGCASFDGTDPQDHKLALGFLATHCGAPAEWQVLGNKGRGIPIRPAPASARTALKAMPPLLKAYMRIGAWVGSEAVIDADFGTTDVFVTLPVSRINPRYFGHFGAPDQLLIS